MRPAGRIGRYDAVPIAASGSSGSSLLPLLFVILIIGAMYFLMIRPQQRRSREMQAMQSTLAPGAEVMTSSGIYGEVIEIDESDGSVVLEISPDVHVKFARGAIARVVTPADAPATTEEPDDEADADLDVAEPAAPVAEQTNPVIERQD